MGILRLLREKIARDHLIFVMNGKIHEVPARAPERQIDDLSHCPD